MHHLRVTAGLLSLLWMCAAGMIRAESVVVELELSGRRIEGTPLAWSTNDVVLLGRDGHLWTFHPSAAANYRKVADHFTSLPASEMRNVLRAEFGKSFEVSTTSHYLVVHPRGARADWAPRFEEMYRNFWRYFSSRGLEPQKPAFPLIAVVLPDEQAFHRYAERTRARLSRGTLGFYSPVSNRIVLFDITRGQRDDPAWQINAETIVHEAIHQMAFNTGVHSRYHMPPRWVAEGLGMLFEARGVWNASRYAHQQDRVNRNRWESFQAYLPRRKSGSLPEFISSDRLFQLDPEGAYAEAWAFTFFLFETQPKRYVEYLRATAARPSFTALRGPEQLAEFTSRFGSDLRQLERRYLDFIAGLGR